MTLSLRHPFPPMEAMSVDEVPEGKNWQYEPKWDGFRCLIVFDLLVDVDGKPLTGTPLIKRRALLERFARKYLHGNKSIRLSPMTTRLADARKWLKQVGATLDGIIAKRASYESGNRHGMQKIKNYRTADCVVGGFRYNEGKKARGDLRSLLEPTAAPYRSCVVLRRQGKANR